MSKARRVSKILDGELKTDAIGLKNPTREAPPAGLESQSDANIELARRVDELETPEGLPDHTHEYADKQHDHPKEDYEHDHDAEYAQRQHAHDSDYAAEGHNHDQKYELLNHAATEHERLDDKIDKHAGNEHKFLPLAGGTMDFGAKLEWASNDGIVDGLAEAVSPQSPVRKKEFDAALLGGDENLQKIEDNTAAIEQEVQDRKAADALKSDKDHTHDADTAAHDHPEYQPKGDYADGGHTHDPQDLTHDHDSEYSGVGHAHPEYEPQDLTHDHDAEYKHDHPYASDTHDHDAVYADADHEHDPIDLTHDHADYFLKGQAVDDDGDPLPLPYGNAFDLGTAVDDVKEENGEQNDRLDVLEAAPTVAIGDNPPSDEKSKDGDLWWDSARMEMFIRYQEAWITTNALSARVEAGERVQAELLDRVAVGEAIQQQLEPTVAKNTQDINNLHNQVNQIRDEVNHFVRPIPWKYKSSSTEPIDLEPGEFTARTSGSESDGAGATIDFYFNEFDACGMRWYPQFAGSEYHHDLSGNFMITVGMLGSGVSLHAKSGKWTWNHGGNRYAKISGAYRKQKSSLMNNFLYIINLPGYLPMFATDQQINRVFTLEDETPEGDVPFEVED